MKAYVPVDTNSTTFDLTFDEGKGRFGLSRDEKLKGIENVRCETSVDKK